MILKVYNKQGEDSGRTVNLSDEIFGIEPNDHAIYLDVKQFLANGRQGTHKTKDRSEISLSTKKIVRQKGSGGARHGSIKAGTFVGGGRIHGPRPRDYSFKLNKKLKRLARASALAYKAKGNNIIVVDSLNLDTPKTRDFAAVLKNLKADGQRVLVVTGSMNKNVYLAGRNIPGSAILPASDLNTYEIMKAKNMVITEDSLAVIENIVKN